MDVPEYLSEPTKLSLNRVPSFIKNWWVLSLTSLVILILSIGFFIQFPTKLSGTIVFSSVEPDLELVAKSTGRLYLNYDNNELVRNGMIVGYVHSDANVEDVLSIDSLMNATSTLYDETSRKYPLISLPEIYSRKLVLGSLQQDYELLQNYISQFIYLKEKSWTENQINSINQQKKKTEDKIYALIKQRELTSKSLSISAENIEIDKKLLEEKVLANYDYNNRLKAHLNSKKELNNIEFAIAESEETIKKLELQIIELQAEQDNSFKEIIRLIKSQSGILSARIKDWKDNHLLIAPKSGLVLYPTNIENEKYVKSGATCCYILPQKEPAEAAKLLLPSFQIGELKTGQKVVIKLDGYPFQKYGVLFGSVAEINLKQEGRSVSAKVLIEQPMKTSSGHRIPLIEDMTGTAEVIIKKQSLLQRSLYVFKGLQH